MLVNFALGEAPINITQVFKGGPWKARLTAKRSAQYRQQKNESGGNPQTKSQSAVPSGGVDNTDTAEYLPESGRPQKRQRLETSHDDHSRYGKFSKTGQEVVSSLFSYNPVSKPIDKEPVHDTATPVQPSNAPLIDGLDTFTTLGLSTTIAAHLLTKLNLKAPTAIQRAAITQLVLEDSDAFIQAETGSGKTLAYLLPIVQRVMDLSKKKDNSTGDEQVHRDSGLFAIILAPTRELCKQISTVLDNLLRCAHWIVAGTVIGGEKKKSEKARLRKGLNILVATPGRLADHLSNTKVLDVSNVRWLVLDEGDRLMELGFEEEIRGIVSKLDDRSRVSRTKSMHGLPARRTTVMCSATMKMNVQRLGEISLKDAVHIKADPTTDAVTNGPHDGEDAQFSAPAQLKQSYVLVPAKQRLVTLAALLKRTFARKGSVMKAIVFLSCADSVDFHFALLGHKPPREPADNDDPKNKRTIPLADTNSPPSSNEPPPDHAVPALPTTSPTHLLTSPQNPHLTLHKLHGSLTQPLRTATLAAFTRSPHPSILLCTDVASRGLDLPNIDLVIEFDPPFSSDDHLHRVGRTARAGRDGRAIIFLMPGPEEGYVAILKSGYRDGVGPGVTGSRAEEVLKRGFGAERGITAGGGGGGGGAVGSKGHARDWEERATAWQLDAERWVIEDAKAGEMARRAFVSHVRAYATHVLRERGMFDVKGLHLGHLAKAFALRERPGSMGRGATVGTGTGKAKGRRAVPRREGGRREGGGAGVGVKAQGDGDADADDRVVAVTEKQDAARRMRKAMDRHMAGAGEFNLG